jgi:hypothetical protein
VTGLGVALERISVALHDASVPFALVGGLAVSVRAEPRFTRDVDLAVAVTDDAAAEALVRRLAGDGWRVGTVIEQEAVERLVVAAGGRSRVLSSRRSRAACRWLSRCRGIQAGSGASRRVRGVQV